MDKNRKLLIAGVLLILFAAAKLLLLDWWQKQQPQAHAAECDLIKGCTLPDGSHVRSTPISHRSAFDITVENAPAETQQVSISFSMKDMDMGFNRYMLQQQSPRTWQARQIRLPVCVEGRRDYIADITIGGQTFQTTFTAQ
jgi:putative secreted protein